MMAATEANFQKSLGSAFQDYCPQNSGSSISSLESIKRSPTLGTVPNFLQQNSPKESSYWSGNDANGVVLTELDSSSSSGPPTKKIKYEITSPVLKTPPSLIGTMTPISSKYRRKSQFPSDLNSPSSIEKTPKNTVKSAQKRTPKNKTTAEQDDSKDDIGRQDSSLLRLTKMFLEQNMCDDNGIVNLNDAADKLNVQKRRLYDITNVLEGINMIEKVGKNSIRWKQLDGDENKYEKRELLSQVQELRHQENHLDSLIQNVTNALQLMKEDATEQPYFYLKFNELKNIPCFKENTIIAVKAPKDSISVIEVSDPHETGKFEIAIRNQNSEPLNAFYLSNENDGHPVEMGQDNANHAEIVDMKIPISQMNSFNDSITASPLLSSSNQRTDDPLLNGIYQSTFYDEWDSGYPQPSSSGLHHSNYPNFTHLASPLKNVFDSNHHNNDLTDLSMNNGYISLEPAPDPAPYMYGMSENEIFPTNLYDNQDW